MSFAELLTQEQVERVHDASLEILQEVGLKVRYKPARELFEKHGCITSADSEIVAQVSPRGGGKISEDGAAQVHIPRTRSSP